MNLIITALPSNIGEKIHKKIEGSAFNPMGGWEEWGYDCELPWSTFLSTRKDFIKDDNYVEVGYATIPYIHNCPWKVIAVVEHPYKWVKKAKKAGIFHSRGDGLSTGLPTTNEDYLKLWKKITDRIVSYCDFVYRWEDIWENPSVLMDTNVKPKTKNHRLEMHPFTGWGLVSETAEKFGYYSDKILPCSIHQINNNVAEESSDIIVELPSSKVDDPVVQIVMPAYNSSKWIRQAIQSIIDQKFSNWELIVIDDGSSDSTFLIASAMAATDTRIRVMRQTNGGTGSALNAAWRHLGTAPYQTWWASDSWAEPNWLSDLVAGLDSNPDVGFVYGDHAVYQQSTRKTIPIINPEFNYSAHQTKCEVGCCWLWRKEVKDLAGDWSLNICEDYEMWLRMADICKFKKVSGRMGYWREHDSNLSLDCNKDNWKEHRRIVSRNKWKKADIKVASVCGWLDPAAVCFWNTFGFNESKYPVATRFILKLQSNLKQCNDLLIDNPEDSFEIKKALDECDIIHNNCTLDFDFTPWAGKGKKFLYHLHAGPWTTEFKKMDKIRSMFDTKIVSCEPGISGMIPDAIWVPNPIFLDPAKRAWDYHLFEPISENYLDDTEFRMHMHHNYEIGKHTIQIKQAINDLKTFHGLDVPCHFLNDYDTCMPIREHIQFKKNFNVCVDTIVQGFIGMAGFISMAQGSVVIARLDEHSIREYTALGEGNPPPIVNVRGINEFLLAVIDLYKNPEKVREIRKASREWMLKYYNIERIFGLWTKIYEEMLE